jgi:hypothetical protein
MEPRELTAGEIMQINPDAEGAEGFGGCMLIVKEPKSFGCNGYVKNAGASEPMYVRVQWQGMEPTGGMAVWEAE